MLNNVAAMIQSQLNKNKSVYDFQIFETKDVNKIQNLYLKATKKYPEFLYIPSYDEIDSHLQSDTGCYLGAKTKQGKIINVTKIEHLTLPSAFFVPPAYEDKENGVFFGLSGLVTDDEYRKQGVSKFITQAVVQALHLYGATGLYADCDYRNVASCSTLSSVLNFVGFADGRNGAEGEKTIYTTFYLNLQHPPQKQHPLVNLDFSAEKNMDGVVRRLKSEMSQIGFFSVYKVPYGGGYNELHVLDENIQTQKICLALQGKDPVCLVKRPLPELGPVFGENERG